MSGGFDALKRTPEMAGIAWAKLDLFKKGMKPQIPLLNYDPIQLLNKQAPLNALNLSWYPLN